jgi:hypothetical protein
MGGGDQRLAEVAPRECGHVLVEHAPKVVKPPLAHKPQRRGARRIGDVVEHPKLVVVAERRWPPGGALVARRDGHCARKSACTHLTMRPAAVPHNSVVQPAISRTDHWTSDSPSGEAPAEGAGEQVRHRKDRPRDRDKGCNGRERDNHEPDQCEARHDQGEQHHPQEEGAWDPFEPIGHDDPASTPVSRAAPITRATRARRAPCALATTSVCSSGPPAWWSLVKDVPYGLPPPLKTSCTV